MRFGDLKGTRMEHPTILSAGERPFATFPVAVQAIIVNEQEQILLLSSGRRGRSGIWQTISGGLKAGETILWMLRRAVQLYRLWKDEEERPLQPFLSNQ